MYYVHRTCVEMVAHFTSLTASLQYSMHIILYTGHAFITRKWSSTLQASMQQYATKALPVYTSWVTNDMVDIMHIGV